MKAISLFIILLLIGSSALLGQSSYTKYVDPFIGTDETHVFSIWRMEAATYPGAVAPHGMAQLTPETSSKKDFLHGYYYSQDTIRRFSLVDHLSGWPNGSQGKISLMPSSVESIENLNSNQLKSSFSHEQEKAEAGYYQVYLKDSKIDAEFSALGKSAIGKFNFEKEGLLNVIALGVYKNIEVISDKEIILSVKGGNFGMGNEYTIHVYLIFDHSFNLKDIRKGKILVFEENELYFKYGVSYTSKENAKKNLLHEIPNWDLRTVRKTSNTLWEKELSRMKVEDDNEENKTMFYTALYHASLIPINATDVNRQFPGYEQNEALKADETHYVYFTPWDAFRTTYPLVNLINPKKGRDYMRSMVRFYHSYGKLPEPEVMTSVFVSSMIADALAKGITDFDTKTAYKALKEMMLEEPFFRPDTKIYNSLGYVPFPNRYATTATMEFAFNNWSLAQIANYIGDKDLAKRLEKQSLNYRNNYHPRERYFLSKEADGSWAHASIYAEADKYNMSWMVPHNVQDLINLMGGEEAFTKHLEDIFINEHFVLDNECPMIFPYLFAHVGKPDKASKWKNSILKSFFNATPGGIPGNDDWGTMSSWYIWGAMGLFPVTPGSDELIITAPIFDKITLQRSEQQSLTLKAKNLTDENQYISSASLNGVAFNQCFLHQNELKGKDVINFSLTSEPTKWGTNLKPYSITKTKPEFNVNEFTVEKIKDNLGRTYQANIKVTNKGAMGSFLVKLLADNQVVYEEWVLIDEGQEHQHFFTFNLYKAGKQTLRLADKAIEVKVPKDQLAKKDRLYFEKPIVDPFIQKGQTIELQCRVQNISSKVVEHRPKIYLNKNLVKELDLIELKSGEKKLLKAELLPLENVGLQKLRVGNSSFISFKVYEKNTDALALHYTFDNDGGKVKDISGFENDGERMKDVQYVEGVSGKGLQFKDEAYIKIPDRPSLDISDDEITILCWYKPAQENGRTSLVTRGAHNMLKLNGKWQVKWAAGGWGRGQSFYNSKSKEGMSEPSWFNNWTHLVGTRNAKSLSVFHNGIKVNTIPHKGKILSTEFEWRIGSNSEIPHNSTPFGVIDEVMIFAKALSEKEIRAIYNRKNKP